MSGFPADWLALREPADHRARHDFTASFDLLRRGSWNVVDLGCGTGSNLRYLAQRLPPDQRWTCIDNDAALLAALNAHRGTQSDERRRVSVRNADLAGDLDALIGAACAHGDADRGLGGDPGGDSGDDSGGARLVTASALLDLASAHWLAALIAAGARVQASFWLALSYDGRIELEPALDGDAILRALVNAHQHTDKGFGAALGPHAHAFTAKKLAVFGYTVHEAVSDWRLGPDTAPLVDELLSGWVAAARELACDRRLLGAWEAQRREQLAAGTLRVRVGHRDLFAAPGRSA